MIGFGQEWTFGGSNKDWGRSVQQTTDGGYIITGETSSFGDGVSAVYVIKTDGSGTEQWSQTYGDYDAAGYSVQQTTDGGYIITGYTETLGNGGSDVYLLKTDGSGDSLWTKTFGGQSAFISGDEGYSVQQTTDGGYIITGKKQVGLDDWDAYLIKTDGNGVEQWSQTFGGTEEEWGNSVQQTTDGGYIITGRIESFGNGNCDVYLIKTNGNGTEEWSQTFGGVSYDFGSSIQQTTDGGYIITGYTESFGNGGSDVYLIKTNGNGTEQWSQTFGGASFDWGTSVQQTTDGGYIITGYRESLGTQGATGYDVYLIKTNGNGTEQWSQTFGGVWPDGGYSVQQTTDGGYIITGRTGSFGNGYEDFYLIKTDGSGNITSTFNIPINPNRKLQKTVDVLGKETKPKTNTPFIEIYDDGTVEKRIVIE